MGKLIALLNITPDGFCDHTAVIADEELHEYANELVRQADAVVFGKNTFLLFREYWPGVAAQEEGLPSILEFSHLIDRIPKIVVSTTLQEAGWKNASIIGKEVPAAIARLKDTYQDMLIMGSPGLLSSLIETGVIDEFRFCMQPLFPGKGKRLFETANLPQKLNLELIATRHFESGAFVLQYEVKK